MTLKQPVGLFRVLLCDQPGCARVFDGVPAELVSLLRSRARRHGWFCHNPGPGTPARDLCPEHRITMERP